MQFSIRKLAAVTFLAVTTMPVAASELREPPAQATVRFQDLDLSRPGSIEALYARIHAAAVRVCREEMTYLYLEASKARSACVRVAVADAVSRINLPALTAIHREAGGDLLSPRSTRTLAFRMRKLALP